MIENPEARLDAIIEGLPGIPEQARIQVLGTLQSFKWRQQARPEQVLPPGDWRTWYSMGGRGSGKSRAGAQGIAELESQNEPGIYAIIAPVFADAVKKCVEGPGSGLLEVLGERVSHWNRGSGELFLKSGSQFYCDGADDGADRIQGFNLRGVWADEVGLWAKNNWEKAWFFSILPAVRLPPGKIVATGTPKMGHPLVQVLMSDKLVPKSHMRTSDNLENLDKGTIDALYEQYGEGTHLRRQELDGEWIAALEGDLLKRSWWRYYSPDLLKEGRSGIAIGNGDIKFQMVVISVDTPLRDKDSSDNVAIQCWGVDRANRYLLNARAEKMSYDQCHNAIKYMSHWAKKHWPRARHYCLIENAGYGPGLITELTTEIGGVFKMTNNVEGTKGQRADEASAYLEAGNVFLPGKARADGSGPDESSSPALTISLVDEAAMFQLDGSHASHDDQVDAWSQCMNWLKRRSTRGGRAFSSFKTARR